MQAKQDRAVWLDYLRGFITVLVVAHHSSLAYTTFASFNKQAYILSTNPVVDTARSFTLDIFEDFNDVFFMSMMFLISGIFVLPALARKGSRVFMRDRFYRLFIPFVIGVTILAPIAYLPAWHLAHGNYDLGPFLKDFFTVEGWPPGPPWFIWVLFFFNLVIAVCYTRTRAGLEKAGAWLARQSGHPARTGLYWYLLTCLLLLPLVLIFGSDAWTGIGPFDFQLSRPLLYFGYFVLGMLLGLAGTEDGLLAKDSKFNTRRYWVIGCFLAYSGLKLVGGPILALYKQGKISGFQGILLYRSVWTLSCTASCIAFLTFFRRRFTKAHKTWSSLSANAYGIYLVHYLFVTWLQFLLLPAALPALVKFAIVFLGSLTLSWMLTALLRRIPLVKKYL
jgi:glucans biosynthesis protein C